jgi:hypothetical protein
VGVCVCVCVCRDRRGGQVGGYVTHQMGVWLGNAPSRWVCGWVMRQVSECVGGCACVGVDWRVSDVPGRRVGAWGMKM